jgi:tetratricopeptide (TPR) repeat protein
LGLALHEHHALGEGESALAHYQRSAAAYWEAGYLRKWAGVNMAASLLWHRGTITDRLHLGQEVVRVSQEAADRQGWGWGLFMMATALDQAGDLDEAVTDLQRTIELAKGVPDHQVAVFASGVLARCHLRQGNVEKALTVLAQSCQEIRLHRLRGFSCVPVWMSLAQAYLLAADRAEKPASASARRKARRACQVALKQSKFDRGSLVAACRMQGSFEWLRGKSKTAQQWWQRSLEVATALGAHYELGLTHLEMGKCLGDPSHLERGEAIFVEMGANFDLAQARKLLRGFRAP